MRSTLLLVLFVSVFVSCSKEPGDPEPGGDTQYSLQGETWVLTMYHDTSMSTPVALNDTIVFTGQNTCVWDGVAGADYLSHGSNAIGYRFEFENTPFGIIAGTVPENFRDFGQIVDCPFSFNGNTWY